MVCMALQDHFHLNTANIRLKRCVIIFKVLTVPIAEMTKLVKLDT